MESFEELGISPELVEALNAEGIETPTEFQRWAIPVLLRGNSVLAQAGPGAGTLISYGIALLQRTNPESDVPEALVLTPSLGAAADQAVSLARLALTTGHRVGALDSNWALPERVPILFAAPENLLRSVNASEVTLSGIRTVVVDGFAALQAQSLEALETLFESLPKEGQRILLSQPFSEKAEAFGRAHFSRAVHLPPKPAQSGVREAPRRRGEAAYRLVSGGKEPVVLQTVAAALNEGARHVLLFCKTEDDAADVGDFLSLHGYTPGASGEKSLPVWLATDELESRKILDEQEDPSTVATLSVDVPADPDSLDRRHGGSEPSIILVRTRELPHLRDLAHRTGYGLVPAKEPMPMRVASELVRLRGLLERALGEEELAPYYLALEPLFERHSAGEVAAAALALLQQRPPMDQDPRGRAREDRTPEPRKGPPPKAWVRLFMGVGEKDGVGPGDLLGAIAGEAGVEGSQVGKIEIRETFSLVEVAQGVAEEIIQALNGTTIRGRAVRVDHDRGGPRGRGGSGPRPRRRPRRGDSSDQP